MIARREVVVVVAVLAVGIALSVWGASDTPDATSNALLQPGAPPRIEPDMRERGRLIDRRSCAGCHARGERLAGPSYLEIAAQYRDRADALATIALATTHPSPGFASYPPGPTALVLDDVDRTAVAA